MNYISPIRNYFKFALAREFYSSDEPQGPFVYQKGFLEKTGEILVSPVLRPCDGLLKNIREPFMITAITVSAMSLTSLFFYPEETTTAIQTVVPFASYIKPSLVKFGVFLGSELVILGLGCRTLGRLCNNTLVAAWEGKTITPISLGTVIPAPPAQ